MTGGSHSCDGSTMAQPPAPARDFTRVIASTQASQVRGGSGTRSLR